MHSDYLDPLKRKTSFKIILLFNNCSTLKKKKFTVDIKDITSQDCNNKSTTKFSSQRKYIFIVICIIPWKFKSIKYTIFRLCDLLPPYTLDFFLFVCCYYFSPLGVLPSLAKDSCSFQNEAIPWCFTKLLIIHVKWQ